MGGTGTDIDRELLGRVAALKPGQQRWLRTVLQSVFTMDLAEEEARVEERPARRKGPAAPERRRAEKEPRRQGLDKLVSGEGISEEEYPELAEELKGIADVADLLREGGRERRRFGEELMRLFEADPTPDEGEEEDGEDEGGRLT